MISAPIAGQRLVTGVTGGLASAAAAGVLRQHPRGVTQAWQRPNHHGAAVSLIAGPAITVAAATSAAVGVLLGSAGSSDRVGTRSRAVAVLLAGLSAGVVGRYDDLAKDRDLEQDAKGFHGHLRALRRGQLTAGSVKVVGIGTAALGAGALLERRPSGQTGGETWVVRLDAVVRAGVVAGSANLVNLLDLRPGRALKTVLLVAGPLALTPGPRGGMLAGPAGAALALLPGDLGERTMLGDCGANAVGAVLGVGLAAGRDGPAGRAGRAGLLVALVALTAASEVVSFSQVIDRTPPLRWLDRVGRTDQGRLDHVGRTDQADQSDQVGRPEPG